MTDWTETDILLLDYLSGGATPAECKVIENWIDENKKNRAYYEQFRKDYHRLKQGGRAELITHYNFDKLKKRLQQRHRFRMAIRIAASIALLLSIGYGTAHILSPRQIKEELSIMVARQSTILPGKSKAILHLSNGEEIVVANENQELQETNGTSIKIKENGEISYNPMADSTSTQLVYNRLIIPRGGEFTMTLEDGSKVWLNSDSELKYPVSFIGKKRIVYLKGEAYFDVKADQERPFIVSVGKMNVEVCGTQFNINTHTQGHVETVLVEGKVQIVSPGHRDNLHPSERAIYSSEDGRIAIDQVDVSSYIGWKNGDLIFQHESLEKIMDKLALWYDVKIFYQNEEVKNVILSGEMKKYEDIRKLLYFFEKTSNVKFSIKGKAITVSYK